MLSEEVKERFSKISKICRPLTNCYSMQTMELAEKIWSCEDSFAFSYNDHGVKRLVFFCKDASSLEGVLQTLPREEFSVDVMAKSPAEISSVFENNKFETIAKMKRLVNADCRSLLVESSVLRYKDEFEFSNASIEDVCEINSLLWSTFDTRISRLLNDEELRVVVENGGVTIHRDGSDKIDAVLQLEILPKKFYINQVINLSKTPVVHSMMLNALERYVEHGGKYMYCWVEEKNMASLKFHSKYGMKHDGMWNLVFSMKR